MNRSVSIPANGELREESLGPFRYLLITAASVPFQISFNGSQWEDAKKNDLLEQTGRERAYFRAKAGLAAEVSFTYDTEPIRAQDVAASVALTNARGNNGEKVYVTAPKATIAGGANYNPSNPDACANFAAGILCPGIYLGKKRKHLIIQNNGGTPALLFDTAGNLFWRLAAGATVPFPLETSDDLYILGEGGASNQVLASATYFQDGQ